MERSLRLTADLLCDPQGTRAHALDGLQPEAGTILEATAVGVCPPVEARREELGRQVDEQEPDRFETEVMLGGESDTAVLCYTSGTTGLPKGAMLTQGVAGAIIEICHSAIKDKVHFDQDTKALQLLPSYSFSLLRVNRSVKTTSITVISMTSVDRA